MSIVGSRITKGGHEWQVASTVRAGAGLRIILKAVDDPECRMLVKAHDTFALDTAADLSQLLAAPESRSFRDQEREMWRVTLKATSGAGIPMGGWLVFEPEQGGQRVRILHEDSAGIGSLTDEDLVKLLFHARRTSA